MPQEGANLSAYERNCLYLNLNGTDFMDASFASGADIAAGAMAPDPPPISAMPPAAAGAKPDEVMWPTVTSSPIGFALSRSNIETIGNWIDQGAKNN